MKPRQQGFTLVEIRAMLANEDKKGSAGEAAASVGGLQLSREQCVEQIKLLERQKKDIEDAIAELRRTYTELYRRSGEEPI